MKKIVVIPAYEPPKSFVEYAREISRIADSLIVVNDGSSDEYERVFDSVSSISNVVYIKYSQNRGKGYALKQAFSYCSRFYSPDDVIVTADCDGQHIPRDVARVAEVACRRSDTLVLGARDFTLSCVPSRSRLGNTNMRRIFRLLYGIDISDTQTGLRGFSVSLAKEFASVSGDRFDYEMRMLIFAQRAGIRLFDVPISTVYSSGADESGSHFRTIRDSIGVLGATFGSVSWYALSSVVSAVIDFTVFVLISQIVLGETSALNTLIATVTARVASSILNCFVNFKYAFCGKGVGAVIRYYILWLCQLSASYGIVFLFGNVLGFNLMLTKAIGDVLLGCLSFQIQKSWVFNERIKSGSYTGLMRVAKRIARVFSKKYGCGVLPYNEPCVYVCRHLDMHGPFTTLKWLDCDVHPMVLYPFFTKNDCYRQYAEYTFTERVGKRKKAFNLKAYLASRIVPMAVNGVGAIPVYRSSAECVKTFRGAMRALEKGESIIVFPDIEYTADAESESGIYDGFLYLGKLFKRRTGRDLRFVPLYINESKRRIEEGEPITVSNPETEREQAAEYIRSAINGLAAENGNIYIG